MLKRYIGSQPEVAVMIRGTSFGAVKTGEAIPIPDDIANSVAWPEANWEDVTDGSTPNPNSGTETETTNETEAS